MSETIKAWVYSRIDAPEDSHGSLKHQDQQLCEYAEKDGNFKVVGHSQDLAAAYNLDRPGLKALTDAVKEQKSPFSSGDGFLLESALIRKRRQLMEHSFSPLVFGRIHRARGCLKNFPLRRES